MTLFSNRAKEPIKTSLGIMIAYAVSMSMGWDNPMWAGFTVAFISLATVGHSFRRGILRMLGTLMGGAAALTLIALFAQQRWLLMVALSLYIGFCTYRMLGSRNPYFYFVGAFVSVVILFTGGLESLSAFDTVVARTQETGMGILVYTLIAVFLWPQHSGLSLDAASQNLIAVQRQLFGVYRGVMMGNAVTDDSRPLRMQQAQLAAGLGQALDGAEADSYAVWRLRRRWHHLKQLSGALGEALEGWHTCLAQAGKLDLTAYFPQLEGFLAELDNRFARIERMLAAERPDQEPAHSPRPLVLEMSIDGGSALNHLETAAVVSTHAQLERIEQLSRELFDCVAGLKNPAVRSPAPHANEPTQTRFSFDPDRFGGAIRVTAGLWIGLLTWIYADPPASGLLIIFIVAVGMLVVQMPWVPVWKLFVPVLVAAIFGGLIHILVMPHLTTYVGLGALIFGVTFVIGYLFANPKLAVLRGVGLAMFLYFISVDNQQVYSFSAFANQAVTVFLATLALLVSANIPTSSRPEKVFTRLVRRFFRHAETLIARLSRDWTQELGWFRRAEMAFYGNDLQAIPRKLAVWGAQIDHRAFPDNDPKRVQALVNSFTILAHHIQALTEARRHPQADFLVQELLQDARAWRLAMQRVLSDWGDDPAAAAPDAEQSLDAQVDKMEARIAATLEHPRNPLLNDQDYQNFYRLMGAFRSVNQALIAHQHLAAQVEWAGWRKARF